MGVGVKVCVGAIISVRAKVRVFQRKGVCLSLPVFAWVRASVFIQEINCVCMSVCVHM